MELANFIIPRKPEDLLQQTDGAFCVSGNVDLEGLTEQQLTQKADATIGDLNENDALQVTDQGCFDDIYALVAAFDRLKTHDRVRLIDSLCTNLVVLTASISSMVHGPIDRSATVTVQHRNALQQYVFFLHWLTAKADAEAADGTKAQEAQDAAAGKKPAARGRKGAAAAAVGRMSAWDWPAARLKVLKSVVAGLRVDATPLFEAAVQRNKMVDLAMDLGLKSLEQQSTSGMRTAGVKEAVYDLLGMAALRCAAGVPSGGEGGLAPALTAATPRRSSSRHCNSRVSPFLFISILAPS